MISSPRPEDSQFVKNLQKRIVERPPGENAHNDVTILRTNVVKGGFSMMKDKHSWYQPYIRERIYISAVVDGSQLDLRLLYREVLPLLRTKAAIHGVDLLFLCLDYGFGDLNLFPSVEWEDHRIVALECLRLTSGLCLISLLADE